HGEATDMDAREIDIFESGDSFLGRLHGTSCGDFCLGFDELLEGSPPRQGDLWTVAPFSLWVSAPLAPDGAGSMYWLDDGGGIWRQRSQQVDDLVATMPNRME